MSQEIIISIREEPIDLFKVLKLDGEVSGGGQAKTLIAEGAVQVNGETETRKRRKIMAGDVIAYLGRTLRVQLAQREPDERTGKE